MANLISPILTSSIPALPLPINSCVSIFFGIHVIWRWKTDAYEILNNKQSYFAGCCLEFVSSYNPFGNYSIVLLTKIALLGRRLLNLQTQYKKTSETYQTLVKTLLFQRSYDIHVTLTGGPVTDYVFGVTTNRWLRIQAKKIGYTAIETLTFSVKLFFEMFELSQHCILVLESLRWNDQSFERESLRKFFINTQAISDCLVELAKNQNKLLTQLETLQPFFEKHFKVDLCPIIGELKLSPSRAQEISTMHDNIVGIAKTSADIGKLLVVEVVGKPLCNLGSHLAFGVQPYPEDFCPFPSYRTNELAPRSMRIKTSTLSLNTL